MTQEQHKTHILVEDVPQCDPIRDAASTIVLRRDGATRVLMGQRSASAAFMPNKFVFPGGAVDALDAQVEHRFRSSFDCDRRLQQDAQEGTPAALRYAAARELTEETGLSLREESTFRFVFRAITPPGQSRRFDARFFTVEACDVTSDLDDFSRAEDELSYLCWVTLSQALKLDIPRITRRVLERVEQNLTGNSTDHSVPFYDWRQAEGVVRTLP
jgi:8-oxo-dGTP pyrophosphatase MutT (NUDIX family)